MQIIIIDIAAAGEEERCFTAISAECFLIQHLSNHIACATKVSRTNNFFSSKGPRWGQALCLGRKLSSVEMKLAGKGSWRVPTDGRGAIAFSQGGSKASAVLVALLAAQLAVVPVRLLWRLWSWKNSGLLSPLGSVIYQDEEMALLWRRMSHWLMKGCSIGKCGVLLGHRVMQPDFSASAVCFAGVIHVTWACLLTSGRGLLIFNLLMSSSRVVSPPRSSRWQPWYVHEAVCIWYLGNIACQLTPVFIQVGKQTSSNGKWSVLLMQTYET